MKKTILSILGYLLLFLLAINVLVTAFIPEKSMDYLGYRSFIVLSNSMDPEIKVNDLVVITNINEEDLEVGDIITFSVYIPELRQEGFVTHYIAAIEENELGETIYQTQGEGREEGDYDHWRDANGNTIEITYDDIEGVHLFHVGYVGDVVTALRNPVLIALVIITITVIVVTTNYIKSTREEDEELEESDINTDDYE